MNKVFKCYVNCPVKAKCVLITSVKRSGGNNSLDKCSSRSQGGRFSLNDHFTSVRSHRCIMHTNKADIVRPLNQANVTIVVYC